MADDPLWTFRGYVTPAGTQAVQDWFDAAPDEVKDEIADALVYLAVVPRVQWQPPRFKLLGDGLSELRFKISELNKWVRVYGFFWPEKTQSYTLLLGSEKKAKNASSDITKARKRLAEVKSGSATTHVFNFSQQHLGTTEAGKKGATGIH